MENKGNPGSDDYSPGHDGRDGDSPVEKLKAEVARDIASVARDSEQLARDSANLDEDEAKLEEAEKKREATIIVNGREKRWDEREISYEQLVKIANLPLPPGPNPGFTITYHEGPPHHPDGTLTEGHSVKVVNGMIFNVTPTNKS